MSSTKSSLGNFLTKLVIYPIGFISSIIVARILGPEDRGVYAYLLLLTSFLFPIFTFGFGAGIIYFISSKEYQPKQVLATILYLAFSFGLFLSLLLLVLWKFGLMGETGKNIESFEMVMLLGSIITGSIFYFISRLLLGDSKFSSLNWLTILMGLINPLLLVILVGVLQMKIHGASISVFLINLICCISILIFAWRQYSPVYSYDHTFIKKSFTYGIKGWLGEMAVRANIRLDQIILGAVANPVALGIYSISVLLVELIWIIPDAIGPVLFNKIAAEKNLVERIDIIEKINRILLYISFLVSLILTVLSVYVIIPFGYGESYVKAIYPLLILIPGSIFFITAKVTTKLLSGSGNIEATSTAMVVGSLISIALYLVLIPKYSFIGAAIGSSLGYMAISLACLYQYYKNYSKDIASLFAFQWQDFIWAKDLLMSQYNKTNLISIK